MAAYDKEWVANITKRFGTIAVSIAFEKKTTLKMPSGNMTLVTKEFNVDLGKAKITGVNTKKYSKVVINGVMKNGRFVIASMRSYIGSEPMVDSTLSFAYYPNQTVVENMNAVLNAVVAKLKTLAPKK